MCIRTGLQAHVGANVLLKHLCCFSFSLFPPSVHRSLPTPPIGTSTTLCNTPRSHPIRVVVNKMARCFTKWLSMTQLHRHTVHEVNNIKKAAYLFLPNHSCAICLKSETKRDARCYLSYSLKTVLLI